ncbi:MAG TPA: hypothetical protein VFN10_18005 [Thermoanaerobaculia bacterium]|nr:hypothetical protein [Thermoanaerobaculia bacterium]
MSRGHAVAVAIAHSSDEESRIEQVLRDAGIAFSVTLDATDGAEVHGACALGCVYEVGESDAAVARELLKGVATIIGS